MKKFSIVLILLLILVTISGCGGSKAKTPPKNPNSTANNQSKTNPHTVAFPPTTPQDRADIEKAMKNFWSALNNGDFKTLPSFLYKAQPSAVDSLKTNITKNEVKSFEFVKLTSVAVNAGMAATGYVVLEQMGKGMKTKYPDIGVLALIKQGADWKIVIDKTGLSQQEVMTLTSAVMQEQQNLQKDPDFAKYQKQQNDFVKEAQTTNQNFIKNAQQQNTQQKTPTHP